MGRQRPPQPPDVTCPVCKRTQQWTWDAPRREPDRPRWMAPWGLGGPEPTGPCVSCCGEGNEVADIQDEQLLRRRLTAAGIPLPLQDHRITEGDCIQQGRGEPDAVFQARLRQRGGTGVLLANMDALVALRQWKPPGWAVITGPPGTGKSAWLAGLARRVLTEHEARVDYDDGKIEQLHRELEIECRPYPLAGQRTIHRHRLRTLRYFRVDELVSRERIKWKGDPEPALHVAKVELLFLDELGLDDPVDEYERKMIERVLGYRHDHGLSTVIATNRRWSELTDPSRPLYGFRVRDRLRTGIHVALGGPSWRS